MAGDTNRSIQVLNISNVNAKGTTVLNDGKLLELIQKHPFIYNPRVYAYNDPDYCMWAWKNINAAFNRSYANDPNAAFSTQDLMARWQTLKPLIQCLSKAYDLEAIPQSLRQSVVLISAALENPTTNFAPKLNALQTLLSDRMSDIAALPTDKKLSLEKEILDLLLSSELVVRECKKLDETALEEANQEAENFLDDIGFKQLMNAAENRKEKIYPPRKYEYNCKTNKKSKWVNIKDAHKYIKPCHVRLAHINIEDYLPLSKIIQFSRKK